MAIDYRETLITYLRSDDIRSAAAALDIPPSALSQRLTKLRKAGVKVPKARREGGFSQLEVAQLNRLINKHNKEMK